MNDLHAARNIPGLVRVLRVQRTQSLDLETTFSACSTAAGSILVRPHKRDHLLVFDPHLVELRRLEVPEARTAEAMALHEDRDLLALADLTHLTMFDARGKRRWQLPYPVPIVGKRPWVTCHFSSDARLFWLLLPTGVWRKRGDTLLVVDAKRGKVQEEREIRLALDEGPAWSIHGPHPSAPTIFLEGGMGQDGIISVLASFDDAGLKLDEGKRSVTFVAYGDQGATYASLSHYGDRLDWDSYPGRAQVHSVDLAPLFEELEDGHNWQAHSLGGRRLLIPSSEGRLLVVDPKDKEAIELRLDGDERNWDWSTVIVSQGFLITARSKDKALSSWNIQSVLAPA